MRAAAAILFTVLLMTCVPQASALTAEEIIRLKKNGVSDRTIELMIQSEMQERERQESSIRITEDETSRIYATGKPSDTPLTREERLNVERAWEMLRNLRLEFEK